MDDRSERIWNGYDEGREVGEALFESAMTRLARWNGILEGFIDAFHNHAAKVRRD